MAETEKSYRGELLCLQRLDLYKTEKPFAVKFDTSLFSTELKQHNLAYAAIPTSFVDVKSVPGSFSLDVNGFEVKKFSTSLSMEDFRNEEMVQARYLPEVESLMREMFGEELEQVIFISHQVRERSLAFPELKLDEIKSLQPVREAHADYSASGAATRIQLLLGEDEKLTQPFQIVNVWKVLRGPNRDWPLAVCDFTTLDLEQDIEFCDQVERECVRESISVYPNPKQTWYFVDNQEEDEVLIFRNCHSKSLDVPFSPHAAFEHLPHIKKTPRISFEVRVACLMKKLPPVL